MCKIKPSYDKETAYCISDPFVVYIIRINQWEYLTNIKS